MTATEVYSGQPGHAAPTTATEVAMAVAARTFLQALTPPQAEVVTHRLEHPARTRWTYLPHPRPGVALAQLDPTARKAAHRLLATALSRHAFAQAVTIMALEEVLDADEDGYRGRCSDDYQIAIFGQPASPAWAWRFEGHHLSVTATIAADQLVVAPVFLGAHPARVQHGGRLLVGPLTVEEELAKELLDRLPDELRRRAIVADTAPADIRTTTQVHLHGTLDPPGVSSSELGTANGNLLRRLTALYLDRLAPAPAQAQHQRLSTAELTFAWEGGHRPGTGCYYRIQGPGLLIEYDNTAHHADHAHTVLRRPGADFGADLLASHLHTRPAEHRTERTGRQA